MIANFAEKELQPFAIEFVDEIPKNMVGKALRRVLRKQEVKKTAGYKKEKLVNPHDDTLL